MSETINRRDLLLAATIAGVVLSGCRDEATESGAGTEDLTAKSSATSYDQMAATINPPAIITSLRSTIRNDAVYFNSIEATFDISSVRSRPQFRFQNVEILLDQIADMLERAMNIHDRWDSYRVEGFKYIVESSEEFLAKYFLEKEIQDRKQYGPSEQAKKELSFYDGDQGVLKLQESLQKAIKSIHDPQPDYTGRLLAAEAYLSAIPTLIQPTAVDGTFNIANDGAGQYTLEDIEGPMFKPGYGHKTKWVREVAKLLFNIRNDQAKSQINAQALSAQITAIMNAARKAALELDQKWNESLTELVEERQKGYSDLLSTKEEAFRADGILDYKKKMAPLRALFARDMTDALTRLLAASKGLDQLYDFETPGHLQKTMQKLLHSQLPDDLVYLHDYLNWTRNAIAHIIAFIQSDQSLIMPISIKQILGSDEAFRKALKGMQDNRNGISFNIPTAIFGGYSSIRLRGISAFIVENTAHSGKTGLWQVAIRHPAHGHYWRNAKERQKPIVLDQSPVQQCLSGRVAPRYVQRDPDIVGTSVLHNISPFGTGFEGKDLWYLRMNPRSTSGSPTEHINDIQIDLHVVAQWDGG